MMKLLNWQWFFPLHFYQTKVAAAIVGSAVVGAAASSSSASKASKAQRQSAQAATDAERAMFEQSRADQEPWRQRGNEAGNRLQYMLGLSPNGTDSAPYTQTAEQLREELLPQFIQKTNLPANSYNFDETLSNNLFSGQTLNPLLHMQQDTIDEAGLKAAIEKRLAEKQAALQQQRAQAQKDPAFGSLLKPFTLQDFEKDPGYEFRQAEGMKGLNNSAAARGGLLSGAALKAASRYNQNFASNEFSNAFNRNKLQKADTFNMLSGVSGTGQITANQVANQGAQVASNIGNNILGAGNARASSYIAQGRAFNNALSQGFNAWQQNQYSAPNYSGYQPESSGWAGDYSSNPFQANGL